MDAELKAAPIPGELGRLLAEHRGNKHTLVTDDRTCWFGISGYGAIVVNDDLEIIRRYPLDPSVIITSMRNDRQGNIWVGTDGAWCDPHRPEHQYTFARKTSRIVCALQ